MRAKIISSRRAVAALVAMAAALLFWGGGLTGAAAPGGGGTAAAAAAAVNPHWDAARCAECHPKGIRAPPVRGVEADRLCLRCHDGRAASAEAHPVGRLAAKDEPAPAGWPLNDGRIGCVTCHDVTKACDAKGTRTDENAKLLRGGVSTAETVAAARAEFCRNCHAASSLEKFNPHAMLTEGREVIAGRCLACHTEVPDRGAKVRTGKALLRGGETALCRSCHGKHKDSFNPGHLGAKVKPEMLAYIRTRELVGLAAPPRAELLAQARAAGAKPALMGLAADGTITCTTCHNPHQLGTFAPGTPLAYRPMRVVGGRAVSPVRGAQWCNHCHDL